MTIEVTVPAEWSPSVALATRALLQEAFGSGFPVIACVRPDATPGNPLPAPPIDTASGTGTIGTSLLVR